MSVIAADIIAFLAAKTLQSSIFMVSVRSLFYEMAQRRIGKSATCQIKIPDIIKLERSLSRTYGGLYLLRRGKTMYAYTIDEES